MPLPGILPTKGSTRYTLPPGSVRETITLKVTDAMGNTQMRSISLQTYESSASGMGRSNSPQGLQIHKTSSLSQPTEEEGLLERPPRP